MSVYKNTNASSAIASVEFIPAQGNSAFFTLDKPENVDAVKKWLGLEMGQEIMAEAQLGGKPVLVTRGDKNQDAVMKALEARGDKLNILEPKKPFNIWPLRAGLSFTGQILNLTSSFLGTEKLKAGDPRLNKMLKVGDYARKSFTPEIGVYAICNLAANAINFIYGRQETLDLNGEKYFKKKINGHIAPHLPPGATLHTPEEDRKELRQEEQKPPTALQKVNNFLRRNSVYMSEVLLRAAGSLALLFPFDVNRIKGAAAMMRGGAFVKGFKHALTPTSFMRVIGCMNIGGKMMNMFAKVPDPYSDKPKTWLDNFREKYLFKVASTIEAGSCAGLTYNAYNNKKIGFAPVGGGPINPRSDLIGTAGSTLTTAGYIVRILADFGKKKLDTDEIYAHAEDTLAKAPPEKLPQLMAEVSAMLAEQMKDKDVTFGQIFTRIKTDMYRYHHIPVNSVSAKPEEPVVKAVAPEKTLIPAPEKLPQSSYAGQEQPRTLLDRANAPADSHAGGIARAGEAQLSTPA